MWGLLFKRLAGSVVGTALAPFKLYFLAAAVAIVVGAVGYYIYTAETAKNRVEVLEDRISNLLVVLDHNEASLKKCKDVNVANKNEADEQIRLALVATERVIELEASIIQDIKEILDEVELFITDDTCLALTDDFRQWVRD